MARTGCDQHTAVVMSENIFKRRNRVSKSSQDLFLGVSSILGCEGLYFHSLNREKVINGKYVDFYDEFSNTVIEFNGVYWHARDLPDEYMVYGRSAKQIRDDDIDRTNTILLSGLVDRVHVIWEDEFRKNKEEVAPYLFDCQSRLCCHYTTGQRKGRDGWENTPTFSKSVKTRFLPATRHPTHAVDE